MKKFVFSGVFVLALAMAATVYAKVGMFTGEWDTYFGGGKKTRMTLIQSGDKVSGVYSYQDGKLNGIVTDGVLMGTWVQNRDGKRGTFKFKMSPDGTTFKGKWRRGNKGEWEGEWNGERR